LLAQNLTDLNIVVENRGGAGGNIGMAAVANSAPDGHTLAIMSSAATSNPAIYANTPVDPAKDFSAVSELASVPTVLVVHPSFPAKTVKEMVDVIKKSPGKYSYASSGIGTAQHLAGALLVYRAGLDLAHVPHNGAGPATTAVLGNHMPIAFAGLPSVRAFIASGELRALAVTTLKRSPMLPDVPTIAESGFPGFEVNFWQGIVLPAHTPPAIVEEYSSKIRAALQAPELRKRMDELGLEPVGSTPDVFAAKIKSEMEQWKTFVKQSGISAK
jgi:tripartite-type tricarboxylate transporter receptor subunit TctC